MDQTEFLGHILGSEEGLVCLAKVGSGGEMVRLWVDYPPSEPYLDPEWPYFLPALFSEVDGEGRTRVIAVNVDEVENLPKTFTPSIIENTSPTRVIAYYLLTDWISFEESRTLARKLAPDGDPSSYMRLPGLVNEKYDRPFTAEITRASLVEYQVSTMRRLPDAKNTAVQGLSDWTWEPSGIGPKEFLRDLIDHNRAPSRLATVSTSAGGYGGFDEALTIISSLEINDAEKIYLLKNVATNPYRALKEVGRETAKALARRVTNQGIAVDPLVLELDRARKNRSGAAFVRQRAIGEIARRELTGAGTFIHSVDDQAYYIERDSGQAIQMSTHSEKLKYLIVRRLRINPVDKEFRYIVEELISNVMNQPPIGLPTSVSWFDGNTKSLTVNLGGSRCLRISPQNIDVTENGMNNLIFKTPPKFEPVSLDLIDLETNLSNWWQEFFPGMPNLIGMTEEQASALLRVWVTFFFFQSGASTWPLLVFMGQMGCLGSDTKVQIKRGEHSARTYTLKQVHDLFHGSKHGSRTWDPSISTRIWSKTPNGIVASEIENIVASGVKKTYTVKIQGHEPFRATLDHRFLTPWGFRRLGELQPGCEIICGERGEKKRKVSHFRKNVNARFHPRAYQKRVRWAANLDGKLYPTIPYAWAVLEADMNGLSLEEFLKIVQYDEAQAKTLSYLSSGWDVHHKDENPKNDSLNNLVALSGEEHRALHRSIVSRRAKKVHEVARPIESIELYGEEETYDITMKDSTSPNFLVNGVVVHNSAKSSMGRALYRLIYGVQMDLLKVRSQNAFDTALSNHAIAFFDNVDTKNPWLAESLATAISRTEDDRRKLYTDNDLFSVRNQAMVGITSKDVPFLKEDIIDRMLYFNLLRLEDLGIELIPEQLFHNKTTANRHRYISGLLQDCRKVLATPRPTGSGIQWRIADFVDLGYWIATALGIEKPFIEGLQKLKRQQRGLTLEGDQPLVTALEHFAAKCKDAHRWRSSGELRDDLMLYAPDDVAKAIENRYKAANILSQKLYSIIGIIKTIIPLDYEFNDDTGFKRWRIHPPEPALGKP